MNNLFKLCTASLVLCAIANTAWAIEDIELTPYAGIDAQMRHMGFDKNYGGNVLRKTYPQGNVFFGLKFKEYVGVEFGYEFSKTQRHARTYHAGDTIFGQRLVAASSPLLLSQDFSGHTASRTYGWNFNLVGFFPVLCGDNNLQLIGSLGFARLKLKVHHLITNTTVSLNSFAFQLPLDPRIRQPLTQTISESTNYKHRKNIFRIATGVQHMWGDCLGIRALITWEHTAKLQVKKNQNAVTASGLILTQAKPQNSLLYGVGVFIPF